MRCVANRVIEGWHIWPETGVKRVRHQTQITMKILTVFVLSVVFLVVGVRAQTVTAGGHAQAASPTTPAPAVTIAPSYPVDSGSPAASAAPAVAAPGQIIYAPRLPSVAELANAAAAQGVGIERIEQSNTRISVVYRYSNGQTAMVVYRLLPAAGAVTTQPAGPANQPPAATYAPAPQAGPATQPPVVTYVPAPQVVYAPEPRVVYYDPYDAYYYPYYPRYYYPPVSLSFGFGFRHFGGGFHHRGR